MKFFIKDFFSKCDQIQRKLWIWSHLLKKSLMENLIFCALVDFEIRLFMPVLMIRNYRKCDNFSTHLLRDPLQFLLEILLEI